MQLLNDGSTARVRSSKPTLQELAHTPTASAASTFTDEMLDCDHWRAVSHTTCLNVINPLSSYNDTIRWEVTFHCSACSQAIETIQAERQSTATGTDEGEVVCSSCSKVCRWTAEFLSYFA